VSDSQLIMNRQGNIVFLADLTSHFITCAYNNGIRMSGPFCHQDYGQWHCNFFKAPLHFHFFIMSKILDNELMLTPLCVRLVTAHAIFLSIVIVQPCDNFIQSKFQTRDMIMRMNILSTHFWFWYIYC